LANGFQPKDLQLMMRCFIDVSAMAMADLALPVTANAGIQPELAVNGKIRALPPPGRGDRNLNCLPLKAQRLAATRAELVALKNAAQNAHFPSLLDRAAIMRAF
jgi:hypothetical protein